MILTEIITIEFIYFFVVKYDTIALLTRYLSMLRTLKNGLDTKSRNCLVLVYWSAQARWLTGLGLIPIC